MKPNPSSLAFKGSHRLTTPASPHHLDPSVPVFLDYLFPEHSLHVHTSALVSSLRKPSRMFQSKLEPLHYVSKVLELLMSHSEHVL